MDESFVIEHLLLLELQPFNMPQIRVFKLYNYLFNAISFERCSRSARCCLEPTTKTVISPAIAPMKAAAPAKFCPECTATPPRARGTLGK